jgi:DNA-binding beta-propeller fold protein YncE
VAYLANINDDAVSVVDINSMQTLETISGFDSPYGVVVLPDNSKIYVDNAASMIPTRQYVAVLDGCSRKIIKKIPVSTLLPVSALTKKGDSLYMAEVLTKSILKIDTATDEVVRTYTVPNIVVVAIPNHDGDVLWVGTIGGKIYTLDTESGSLIGEPIDGPFSPGWLSFTPDGKTVVSVNAGADSVSFIDIASRTITGTLDMGSHSFPEFGAVTPDGKHYWVTLGNGKVKVISLETKQVVKTLDPGIFSFGVRISPDGTKAFITTMPYGSSTKSVSGFVTTVLLLLGAWNPPGDVVIYDTNTFEEIDRVQAGNTPTIMGYAGAEG